MPQAAITDRSPHSPPYKRHRPEQTLHYQIIGQYYHEFRDVMAAQGKAFASTRTAGICRLPQMRPVGARIPASAMR